MSLNVILLPGDQVETSNQERRRSVRYPCDVASSCRPISETPTRQWQARIQNISTGGIGLLTSQPFETGTLFTIVMPRTDQRLLRKLVRVVWAREAEAPLEWLLGCEFVHALNNEDVQAILEGR